jgi:LysR family transcriptional regulator (chromosome initiation inhibitor)
MWRSCQPAPMKAIYLFFTGLRKTYAMLDYAALSALAAVVREGSFERAARALHVTPSAISQRIRQLEERVGCALVVRDEPCRPTETGRRLCQHVDRVRLLEQDLQGALPGLGLSGPARVRVPVAANADSLATWLAPALAAFAAASPVLMEVAVDDQDHTAEWLRSGAVVAAVTASARPAAGCNSRPLGSMRYLAAASPAFVARHFADGVGAASLAQAPSLVFNTKDELQALGAAPLPPPRRAAAPHAALDRGLRCRLAGGDGVGGTCAGADCAAPGKRRAGRTGGRCAARCTLVLAARARGLALARCLERRDHGGGTASIAGTLMHERPAGRQRIAKERGRC